MSNGDLQNSALCIDGRPLRNYLLTPRETAKHLRTTERTLERRRLTGDGPPFVKIGALVRYPLSELEKWLADRLRGSTSEEVAPSGRRLRRKARTELELNALK